MGAVIYLFLFLAQFSSIYSSLPKIYFKCHITDSECNTKLTQLNVPAITSGIEELGAEVLDPMVIDYLNTNIAGLNLNSYDIVIRGLKNGVIDNVTVDPETKLLTILYHAELDIRGRYNVSGNLLGLPLFGDGSKTLQAKNLQIELIMPFDIVKGKAGKDVIELKSFQYIFDVDSVYFEYSNLFYENKELSERVHCFINTNSRLIMLLYGRPLLDAINDKLFNVVRTVYLTLPIEDIFYEY